MRSFKLSSSFVVAQLAAPALLGSLEILVYQKTDRLHVHFNGAEAELASVDGGFERSHYDGIEF
jgi:hypothetical protein